MEAKKEIKMKIKDITETASGMGAGSFATATNGSGFASGGIGTDPIRRNTKPKKKSKAKTNKA
jgi:hypothetical protein